MECIQLSLFGKTCQGHSVPTGEKISEPCWKNLPAWNSQTLQFLDLRVGGADGAKPEQSTETDGLWLGDSLMLNIGECPREESVSLLSQILEDNVPRKYYLSARACQGILTRALRRGKALPDLLKTALLDMIEWWESEATASAETPTLSTLQDQTLFQPVVFDARGNGDGITVPTITGDHESRVTDYTAIAVDLYNGAVTGDKAAPITCRSIGSHSGPQVAEQRTFSEQAYNSFKQSGSGGTLKGSGGAVGYGGESLVAEKMVRWIVRRLTPTECERLQGLPDGWTDIGEWTDTKGRVHKPTDTPRYKALGNSIALPQWFWLVQRMHPYLKEKPALGSLFDGLGGFPLVWQRAYGEGTARWASEIEEFPMAVTKRRFGEEWSPVVSTAHHATKPVTTLARSTRQRKKISRSARHSCMS